MSDRMAACASLPFVQLFQGSVTEKAKQTPGGDSSRAMASNDEQPIQELQRQ
jgi:hypothetical protein